MLTRCYLAGVMSTMFITMLANQLLLIRTVYNVLPRLIIMITIMLIIFRIMIIINFISIALLLTMFKQSITNHRVMPLA